MKITLVTTAPELIEHPRIKKEAQQLGHQFSLVNITDFGYTITDNKLKLSHLSNLNCDIAIFRAIFHSIKSMVPIARQLRKKGIKIFDNNLIKHQYSINKVSDLIKLATHHIPQPNTHFTRNLTDYQQIIPTLSYPQILKLTKTGKGAGVYKLNSPTDFRSTLKHLDKSSDANKRFILQDFIPYTHDLRILIIGRKSFTMQRIPPPDDFRANFSLGGTVKSFNPSPETIKLARKALSAIDLTIGGVDVLLAPDKRQYVLEVNHTPGMVGMETATKKNITKHYLKHVIKHAK